MRNFPRRGDFANGTQFASLQPFSRITGAPRMTLRDQRRMELHNQLSHDPEAFYRAYAEALVRTTGLRPRPVAVRPRCMIETIIDAEEQSQFVRQRDHIVPDGMEDELAVCEFRAQR